MFVSVTRLRVRSWRYLPPFLVSSLRASREASRADGNLVTDLLRDAHLAFWTRSLWRDEASMRGFMMAGAHRRMMPKLLDWCDEAAVVHWTQQNPRVADLGGGAPADARRGAALEGQAPVDRAARLRDPAPANVGVTRTLAGPDACGARLQ